MYYTPIWFQSIRGSSAAESGIQILPLMLSMVLGTISGGLINTKIGYYTPLAIVGCCLMSVGAGLITTWQIDAGAGAWAGFQIIYGLGLGWCFQVPNLAAQTVLPREDTPMGLALVLFGQLLGSAVFVSVGENVLANQLGDRLADIPGFRPDLLQSEGATSIIDALPVGSKRAALIAYNESLRQVFRIGLIMSCLAVPGALALEWRSVKKDKTVKREMKPEGKDGNQSNGP